jgi:hypothetical protein
MASFDEEELLKFTFTIRERECPIKRRRAGKKTRVENIETNKARIAENLAAREARRPAFRPEHFDLFKMRDNTMDQHDQVAALPPSLLAVIETYLNCRFPNHFCPDGSPSITARALKRVWTLHPLSLRVKELFETVETFVEMESVISRLQSRAAKQKAKEGAEREDGCEHLYDLACGHGLLGILFAVRFKTATVHCVDLVERPSFAHYRDAFSECGANLSNITFVEGDMANTEVRPRSFVTCIHACNEANVIAMTKARAANAGFAAMPCCIRDGLYSVASARRVDDDTRYAIMIGAMANEYRAHAVRAIDRRITNRHLLLFGGFEALEI